MDDVSRRKDLVRGCCDGSQPKVPLRHQSKGGRWARIIPVLYTVGHECDGEGLAVTEQMLHSYQWLL